MIWDRVVRACVLLLKDHLAKGVCAVPTPESCIDQAREIDRKSLLSTQSPVATCLRNEASEADDRRHALATTMYVCTEMWIWSREDLRFGATAPTGSCRFLTLPPPWPTVPPRAWTDAGMANAVCMLHVH